jgi:TRAP-type mannitol/chloroaromatic compound transport system substrate-binding protein
MRSRVLLLAMGLSMIVALAFSVGCQEEKPATAPAPAAATKAAPAPTPAAPAPAARAPIVWRVQSTWSAADIFHQSFLDLAKKIDEMSEGRLKLEVLPAGAVVPAFELLDAVNRGALDGGHGVPAYWFGRHPAASLFGTGPSLGMDANDLLGWYYHGGGFDLYQELLQKEMGMKVVSFLYGPMPTQPFGWFKSKPITSAAELKGLKYRTVGLSAELFREMGAAVTILAGGEIVPAIERGVIDAAEYNNPTSDKILGFPDVAKVMMARSYHQPVESLELIIGKDKWDALPADLKAIVRYAVMAESADFSWKMLDRNSKDLEEMVERRGVRVVTTSPEILKVQLDTWDRIIDKHTKEPRTGPTFSKVLESQKAWAKRVVPLRQTIQVPNDMAYERYWKK